MRSFLLTLISVTRLNAWYYADQTLPKPLGRTLIGHDNTTSDVYVFGGLTNTQICGKSNLCCENSIYKWNMNNVSAEWIQLDINTTTKCFWGRVSNSVTIRNLVYFVGVYNGSMNPADVQLFDLETERFIDNHGIPPTPISGSQGCVATNNTHIFVVGGRNESQNAHKYLQILDIETNKWKVTEIELPELESNAYGWYNQLCSIVDNYLYVFGGSSQPSSDIFVHGIYKYYVQTANWSYIGNMTIGCAAGRAVYSMSDNIIYLVGYSWLVTDLNQVSINIFDVNQEAIIGNTSYRIPVWYAPALIYQNTMIIIGGTSGSYMYNIFIQMAELPLIYIPTPGPTASPTTPVSPVPTISPTTNGTGTKTDGGVSIVWTVLIICIVSITCNGIGCVIGKKYLSKGNPIYNQQNAENELVRYDSMGDTLGTTEGHPGRIM